MTNIYAPGKQSLNQHSFKLNNISNGYYRILELLPDNISGSTFDIIPQFDDYIRIFINNIFYSSNQSHSIDLTSTGIGGLVDGITFTAANARDFLIWGFATDNNNGFSGFAVTHKPYSAFSAGTGNKGASSRSFTVTNAYQFTVGARVCVRNTNGTAPAYEWNWATITSITDSTHIVLTMDNETYGTNITSASGGEILQWNMFRPWVVSGSGQSLYTNNYRLCGELYTDTSGNVQRIYRVDELFRELKYELAYNSTSTVTGANFYLGRWLPLWSKGGNFYMVGRGTAASQYLFLGNSINTHLAYIRGQVAGVYVVGNIFVVNFDQDAFLLITNTFDNVVEIRLEGYYTEQGMML